MAPCWSCWSCKKQQQYRKRIIDCQTRYKERITTYRKSIIMLYLLLLTLVLFVNKKERKKDGGGFFTGDKYCDNETESCGNR